MRRVLFCGLVLLAAILLQLVVVNSLRLPGGAGPDLVLVVVAALAVTGGPLEGSLAGFAGGLALDVAPPATHLVGQDALVFCLVGYAVGRLAASLEGTGWLRLAAVAAGALAGEVLLAAIGLMFSEPDFGWTAARQVLPPAVIYEWLLTPFVLAAVVALRERTGALAAASAMGGELAARTAAAAAPLAGLAGTTEVVRSTGTGRTPRLRGAGRTAGSGWIGQSPAAGQAAQLPARQRRLRLRGGQAGSAAAIPVTRALPSRPVNLRLGRRGGDSIPGAAVAIGALGDARSLLGGAVPRAGTFRGGPSAARLSGQGLAPRARPRAGTFRGSRSAAGLSGQSAAPRARPRSGAFRGGPSAARLSGAALFGGSQPRKGAFTGGPSSARLPALPRRARPRKGAFSGSQSSLRGSAPGLAGRRVRLRIGTRRSRDGVVGGSVGGMLGRRGGKGLAAGRRATPRFRSGGTLGGLPGRRRPVWRFGSKRTGGL